MLANKRLGEVCGCLRVLPEQLAGGERERGKDFTGGGGGDGAVVARGGARGGEGV
jgi:hypothetical protein